jgi:hypothetical protein
MFGWASRGVRSGVFDVTGSGLTTADQTSVNRFDVDPLHEKLIVGIANERRGGRFRRLTAVVHSRQRASTKYCKTGVTIVTTSQRYRKFKKDRCLTECEL